MSPLAAAVSPTLLASTATEGSAPPPAAGFAALVQAGPTITGPAPAGIVPAGSDEASLVCPAVPAGAFPASENGSRSEAMPLLPSPRLAGPSHGASSPVTAFSGPARGSGNSPTASLSLTALAAPLLDLSAEPVKPPTPSAGTQLDVEVLLESSSSVPSAEPGEPAALEHAAAAPLLEPALLPGPAALPPPATPAAPSMAPAAPLPSDPVSAAPAARNEGEARLPDASEGAPPVASATFAIPASDSSAPALAPGPEAVPPTVRPHPAQLDGALMPQQPAASAQPAAVPSAADARSSAPVPLGPNFGERLGLTLARRVAEGRDEITVRMEPAELGRVQVKLTFDDAGSLRALVIADSPLVLDSLRREAGDLARTLADNGVRTDAQSFRFDRGGGGGQGGEQQGRAPAWTRWQGADETATNPDASALPQPLRHRGRLNLMA